MALEPSPDALRSLVEPGADPRFVASLFSAQAEKRLLLLAWIRRRLLREAPEFARTTGFEASYAGLLALDPGSVREVALQPSFGAFVGVADRLLRMEAPRRLDRLEPALHFARLGGFVVVAAAGSGVETSALAVLNTRAALPLPSRGLVIRAPLWRAGERVEVSTRGGAEVVLRTSDRREVRLSLEVAPGRADDHRDDFRVETVARAYDGGPRLDDVDDLLWRDAEDQRAAALNAVGVDAWTGVLTRANSLLESVDLSLAREVTRYVAAIVPLTGGTSARSLSSSSGDAIGAIRISDHPSPAVQAEAMCHEYHHGKLNALLDVHRLFTDRGARMTGYSPWKRVARPLHGLLHGAYAFYSVARLWAVLAERREGGTNAAAESARRRDEVRDVLSFLHTCGGLTVSGAAFVAELATKVDALAVPTSARAPSAAPRVPLTVAEWRGELDAWTRVGGELRTATGPGASRPLVPEDPTELALCTALGASDGMRPNLPEEGERRLDRTLDALGLMAVLDPPRHAALEEQTARLDPARPLAARLLGHFAYVRGDFAAAAENYAVALDAEPRDLDGWRDLTFSLRNLELTAESDAALFRWRAVAALGERIRPEAGPLRRLLGAGAPLSADVVLGPRATSYALFLRWVAS